MGYDAAESHDRQSLTTFPGTLNGMNYALAKDGYSEDGKVASTPLKLKMPNPIRNIR